MAINKNLTTTQLEDWSKTIIDIANQIKYSLDEMNEYLSGSKISLVSVTESANTALCQSFKDLSLAIKAIKDALDRATVKSNSTSCLSVMDEFIKAVEDNEKGIKDKNMAAIDQFAELAESINGINFSK